MTRIARLTSMAVVATLLAGCAGSVSSPHPPATDSPLLQPSLAPDVEASPTPGGSLPDLPRDLPVHPAAIPVQPPPTDAIGAWTVNADPPEVYDFYLGALPAAGFTIDVAAPGGDVAIIRFSAPDGSPYQLDLSGHDPAHVSLRVPHD